MIPAGHIPGSAMLHVARISDNASLLYTGDFKSRKSRTAESVNFLTADTLIMESTFGLPIYEFPSPMEVDAQILRFVNDCFADGATPILLGYSLGKAQEALALLEENHIPALLHTTAAEMTRACRKAGVQGLPEPIEFDGHAPEGHVIIAPPQTVKTKIFRGLKSKRTAMLSGWALHPGSKFRYGVDCMIPASDHADYPSLIECIQRVRPRRVLTVHGFAKEFAADLRSKKIDAWSAAGGDQLELPIQRPSPPRQTTNQRPNWHKRALCSFADFTDLCRLIEKTGSRVAKIDFLTGYLKQLISDDDLRTVIHWLDTFHKVKTPPSINAATLRHALVAIPGARDERYHEIQNIHQDFIHSACLLLQEIQLRPQMISLQEADQFLVGFQSPNSSLDHIQRISERLATLHPAESETLLKLIIGDLRLNIDSALIEEALASAYQFEISEIQYAKRICGDLGQTAILAKHRQLAHAAPFGASPSPTEVNSCSHVEQELIEHVSSNGTGLTDPYPAH